MRSLLSLLACLALPALAEVSVVDDAGRAVALRAPARRVVSLSPHVTELLFAAGGGARVVGAMNYSDYPEEARRLPLVGSNSEIDLERLVALKPDLLIVWQSGNTARQLEQLKRLGVPMYYSEPRKLEEVATSLERFGRMLGTEQTAARAAGAFRADIAALAARYARRPPVRVFYQIWDKPLYTLNGSHIVSDALRVCGGVNVFAGLHTLAPEVGTEAVLAANPEAIFGGEQHEAGDQGVNLWRPYKSLLAVQRGNLFTLDGELLTRAAPRMAQGTRMLCERIEQARQRRP